MSKTFPVFLTLLLCAAAILPAAAQSTSPINGVFDYDKAKKVVKNINNIRQSQGLRPLKMDASLTEAAMLRAAELAFQREGNGLYNANTSRPNGGSEVMFLEEQCPTLNSAGGLGFACAIHPFTDIGPIVKALNQKDRAGGSYLKSSRQSIGCGAFLSPDGYYSWIIYLASAAATKTEIPSGQWTVDVAIARKEGERTHVVSRTKSDTDLTPTSFEVTGHFNYDKAMEVMELVNKERSRRGLKPYFFDSTLTELAMIRSAEMKGTETMSHVRPNGGYVNIINPFFEVLVINYSPSKGENVGFGQETAEEVMNAWMNSPGHCAAIISKDFTCMGAGEFDGYWTQLFMTPKPGSKLVRVKKSSPHVEEVTVRVALTRDAEESKVLKRKRQQR